MSAGLHLEQLLYKPEGLACLVKAGRSVCRHATAVLRNLKQFLLTYRICALCCHLGSQFGITLRIFNNSLAGKDHRIQEMTLCNIICISNLAFFQFCLCFIYDSFVTDCKYFAIFDGHMSYPIIEIVTWCKNVMFDSFDCFRSHIGCSKFTGCLTFPVFMYFSQLLLGFFCNIKRVRTPRFNGIQFIFQPLEGKFRESLTSSRCNRTASNDQFIITNNDRDITENMGKSFRTPCDHRLTFGSLI